MTDQDYDQPFVPHSPRSGGDSSIFQRRARSLVRQRPCNWKVFVGRIVGTAPGVRATSRWDLRRLGRFS